MMVWAVFVAVGVPLWLIAVGIGSLIFRGHRLKRRPGNIPCRIRQVGKRRWTRGHAIWVSDVFAFEGSPAVWSESLTRVTDIWSLELTRREARRLRRLGPGMVTVTVSADNGEGFEVATRAEFALDLAGPVFSVEAVAFGLRQSSNG
jgi:hypothetical protein